MNRQTWIHASLLGLGLAVFAVPADAKLQREGEAKVTFHATGPAGMAIEGTTSGLIVGEDGNTVVIQVPMASFQTGLTLRDRHMRDKYLEVRQYPNAELRVPKSSLHIPAEGASSSEDVRGKLTLHGQTHELDFHYVAAAKRGTMRVRGRFHIRMPDYGIAVPSYMGVKVRPDVDVEATFAAKDS